MLPNRFRMLALAAAIASITSLAHAQAGSASKWWWESYNGSGSVQLKSPGTVSATRNPTGDAAQPATTAATQPPTVIIQTQSTSGTTGSGVHCVQVSPTFSSTTYNGTSASSIVSGVSNCPAIPGYSVTPIAPDFSETRWYTGSAWVSKSSVSACCYVPTGTATSGSAAYSPWQDMNSPTAKRLALL